MHEPAFPSGLCFFPIGGEEAALLKILPAWFTTPLDQWGFPTAGMGFPTVSKHDRECGAVTKSRIN